MVDFHAHFLPGIDDGADSLDCSLKMLDIFTKQNVDVVVATPHFYCDDSVDKFIARRNKAYDALMENVEKNAITPPKVVLGAEVALTPEVVKYDNLEKLCLGESNTILIELPYDSYSEWMTYAVYDIISKRKLKPVLAHFERFCSKKNMLKKYEKLLSLDVLVQVNADSFLDRKLYKTAKFFAENGMIDVIGSDAHNIDNRMSNLDIAANKIQSKFGKEFLSVLDDNARKLLNLY